MKVNILLKNLAPNEGLEPSTLRLKVWCSTDWANRALWRLTRQCYCHSWTVTNFHFNGAFIIFSLFVSVLTRKMKNWVHCPGIEPGSQEWESCMIPLHQQCAPTEERSFLCVCLRKKSLNYAYFDISKYAYKLHFDVLLQNMTKELGLTLLDGLFGATYSRALSHYCWMRGLLPAAFPPWADSSFLRQPGETNLRRFRHIDTELSADTRST